MPNELTFLLALAVVFGLSVLVVAFMGRPLRGILLDLCSSEKQAGFWTRYSALVLFLLPLAAVMIGRAAKPSPDPLFFQVIDQAKWGLLGLLAAMLIVALGVAVLAQPRSGRVYVSPDQMDDLQRLLNKVEEIRARNILRHGPEGRREQAGA